MKSAIAFLLGIAALTTIRADGAGSPKVVQAPAPVLNVMTDALPRTPNANVWVLATTFGPGDASLWHTHPTPSFVYVQSGTATWEYRGRPADTRHAGQAYMEPANVVTRLANHSATTLSIVIFQVTQPGQPRIIPVH
jgi:quercetin dioxygenase-like cupin family protein